MKKLAAQLYTVRDFTKNAKDFAKTCKRIHDIGYDGVQLSAVGPIPPKEIKKILDGEGLACAATHVSLDRLEKETQAVIDEQLLYQCKFPAVGGFFPDDKIIGKEKTWKDFVTRFNKTAKVLQASGLTLGYHNHFHEFIQLPSGMIRYEYLMRQLDPSCTWFELDTYWAAASGKEPSTLLKKLAHRVHCLHLKDGVLRWRENEFNPRLDITEVGDGNLDWPEILSAAAFAGVQWYIVERDQGEMEAFQSLERSFHNLRDKMGL